MAANQIYLHYSPLLLGQGPAAQSYDWPSKRKKKLSSQRESIASIIHPDPIKKAVHKKHQVHGLPPLKPNP